MSEYWKSTPKYWCKFCQVYVKDTKFEKQQHEATGRHQGNIQRSLKGLHREQQNKEREQQRAKDEVARLNGLVPSASGSASANAPGGDTRVGAKPSFTRQNKTATLDDRKRQLNQLAEMGVMVPDQMRGDMALAGEWTTVSQKVIGEDGQEVKLNSGVRKRKLDEEEQERIQAEEMVTKKKGWGKTFKKFPGKGAAADDDLEGLFGNVGKKDTKTETEVKDEPEVKAEEAVKQEGAAGSLADIPTEEEAAGKAKEEEDAPAPAVVFKKRKKIAK
jgi:hypothetical protein